METAYEIPIYFIDHPNPIAWMCQGRRFDDLNSTSEDSSSGSMSFSGKVAQGYVEGAKVFADLDGDGVRDSNESQGYH